MKKYILFLLPVLVFVGLTLFHEPPVGKVSAWNDDVKLCHRLGNGTYNYLVVDDDAVPGHLGHGDFLYGGGQLFKDLWCNTHVPQPTPTPTLVPTVTPTLEPTATPSATPTPTDIPDQECEGGYIEVEEECVPEPTPTETPRVTPTPDPELPFPQPQLGISSGGFAQCQGTAPDKAPANFHVYRNGDQAVARWYYDANVSWKVVVYYGLTGQGDQHSVVFENKPGSGLIEGLGNRDFDFRAVFTDGCLESISTKAVVDGNTNGWILFR